MNKNAIKKFAIEARKKLIDSVTDKAGMLGITEKSCSEPIIKGADFEVYQTVAGTEVTLNKRQCEQRRRLASQIESRGFEAVGCRRRSSLYLVQSNLCHSFYGSE